MDTKRRKGDTDTVTEPTLSPAKRAKVAASSAGARGSGETMGVEARLRELDEQYEKELEQVDVGLLKEDVASTKQLCAALRQQLTAIFQHDAGASKRDKDAVALQIVGLRVLNRSVQQRVCAVRQKTNELKQQMDSRHLLLQNLLYQAAHLHKQVFQCLNVHSRLDDVDLADINEFQRLTGASLGDGVEGEHELMKARLTHELQQRKDLCEQFEHVQQRRLQLADAIQRKQAQLDGLLPQLRNILLAAEPVQAIFNVDYSDRMEQINKSRHLSEPLHCLFYALYAFVDATQRDAVAAANADGSKNFVRHPFAQLTIEGSVDVAKSFNLSASAEEAVDDEAAQSDDERAADAPAAASCDDTKPTEKSKSSSRRRKKPHQHGKSKEKSARDKLLVAHPLAVNLLLDCADAAQPSSDRLQLKLVFSYLTKLRVVAVRCVFTGAIANAAAAAPWMDAASLLVDIVDADCGLLRSDAPMGKYLRTAGLDDAGVLVERFGQPYNWCQLAAGLAPPHLAAASSPADAVKSAAGIKALVDAIRRRVHVRVQLAALIANLEKGSLILPAHIETACADWFPPKCTSILDSFRPITFDEYCRQPMNARFVSAVDGAAANQNEVSVYCLSLVHTKASLLAWVAVPAKYPAAEPIFSVQINVGNEHYTVFNCANVEAIEEEINIHCVEMKQTGGNDDSAKLDVSIWLLANQIRRLMACLDVFVELESNQSASGSGAGSLPAHLKAYYPKPISGPMRTAPFRFEASAGVFAHR